MPMLEKFVVHRRSWEDWLLLVLGGLIFISPSLANTGYDNLTDANAVIVGLVIIVVAQLEIVAPFRWQEIVNLICGAWIMSAPLVLSYEGELRSWHFGLGGLVVIVTLLELLQDKHKGSGTTT
jgi:predicted MFS family arabinose efflux permease